MSSAFPSPPSPQPTTQAAAEMKALLESTPDNLQELQKQLQCKEIFESPTPDGNVVKSGEALFGVSKQAAPPVPQQTEQTRHSSSSSVDLPRTSDASGKSGSSKDSLSSRGSHENIPAAPKKTKARRLPRVALLAAQPKKRPLEPERHTTGNTFTTTAEPKPKIQKKNVATSRFMQATTAAVQQGRKLALERKKELEQNKDTRGAPTPTPTMRNAATTQAKRPSAISCGSIKAFRSVQSKVNTYNHPKKNVTNDKPQSKTVVPKKGVQQTNGNTNKTLKSKDGQKELTQESAIKPTTEDTIMKIHQELERGIVEMCIQQTMNQTVPDTTPTTGAAAYIPTEVEMDIDAVVREIEEGKEPINMEEDSKEDDPLACASRSPKPSTEKAASTTPIPTSPDVGSPSRTPLPTNNTMQSPTQVA